MAENQYGFPTEVLSLPSQGLLYPEDSPLRSGTIDVKYMTAKEEDILTSTNLIAQGKVIERLLESVIVTPNVKLDDLLVGDKNAVMMGTRILGYGSEYNVSIAAIKKYVFSSYKMIGSPNRKSDTNLEDISDELKNILLCQLV